MDYLEFFDLKEDPFRLTPDPFYYYPSESHKEALSSLNYVMEQKEGFYLATGEPGTGKTTLLNTFLTTEGWKDRAGIALVLTPALSPEEFLLTVLEDLNVKIKNTNKNEIIKAFRDFLIENSMLGRRIVIIVDEAQNLPNETLEELRLLSNLETEKEKLLQIILIGQPELRNRLLSDTMRQLNQRITIRATLRPLAIQETYDYISYRLIKAGKGSVTFEEPAKKLIYETSRGIPRLVNLISSRALMAAFLDISRNVKKRHVIYATRHVLDNTIQGRIPLKYSNWKVAASFIIACLSVIAASFVVIQHIPMLKPLQKSALREPIAKPETETAVSKPDAGMPEDKGKDKTTAVVAAYTANLRAKPSLQSPTVRQVEKGSTLEITDIHTEENGRKWYRVKTGDGMEYWIAASTVRADDSDNGMENKNAD